MVQSNAKWYVFLTLLTRKTISKDTIWDKLVFGKIQALLGGRLRVMIVGSAPIASNVLTFMKCALGCPVSNASIKWLYCKSLKYSGNHKIAIIPLYP